MKLVEGADVHMDPDLPSQLAAGTIATLAGSRYILLEPPHHSAPPDFEGHVFELLAHGWQPLITHPERLRWVEDHYDSFVRLSQRGVWMQITAGALTGRFGARPRYWAEKFLDEGHCHVLATDAHHPQRRPPLLAEARDAAARRVGQAHADAMVLARPLAVIANELPERVAMPESTRPAPTRRAWWRFDRS